MQEMNEIELNEDEIKSLINEANQMQLKESSKDSTEHTFEEMVEIDKF